MGNVTATRPLQPWTAPTASDPVSASLRLPGSKSMTNRALVLSALATGPSTLSRPLRARDTELMAAALRAMGAHVSIADDERWLVRPHRLFACRRWRGWPTGRSPSTVTRTPAPARSAR